MEFKRPFDDDDDEGDNGSGSKLAAFTAEHLPASKKVRFSGNDDQGDDAVEYEQGSSSGGSSSGKRGKSYAEQIASIPSEDLDKDRIEEILDNLPEVEVPTLDLGGLKKLVLKVEKAINKNQSLRLKYPDQPDKFMDSEVDLDEELKRLQIIATAPHLYKNLVALGVLGSWLPLLTHENTDISIGVVDLVKELTDADLSLNEQDAMTALIDNMHENNFLVLLVENLKRLDETVPEESQGVFNTFALLENLLEIKPEIGGGLVEQTSFLQYALNRIAVKAFDANKQYCSEILVILLQTVSANRLKLGQLGGIDVIMKALSAFKKRDPVSNDEAEFMENLFDVLCSSLLEASNKELFLKGEGLELMILMINEKKLARKGAIKTLSYATADPDAKANCNQFVEIKGLPVFFPVFMRRGTKKLKKEYKDNYGEHEEEEFAISILAQLLRHVDGSLRDRLLSKFVENDFEKADRLVELHLKYADKVEVIDEDIDREKAELKEDGIEIDPEDEDDFYLRRLDGGLFQLQLIDLSLAYICTCDEPTILEHVSKMFRSKGASLLAVSHTLTGYANVVGETASEAERDKQRSEIRSLVDQLVRAAGLDQ